MTDPIIIENEDESIVIIVDPGTPTVVQAATSSAIRVMDAGISSILPIIDPPVIVWTEEQLAEIITATGGGGSGEYYRGIINYDGGYPYSVYGDYPHLDGGGVVELYRYRL